MYIQDVYPRVHLSWEETRMNMATATGTRLQGIGSDSNGKVEKELKPKVMAEDS